MIVSDFISCCECVFIYPLFQFEDLKEMYKFLNLKIKTVSKNVQATKSTDAK